MLHILLVILKIIGIVFAVVLGVLLFLFLLFALGPIRYRAAGEADEKKALEGRISWMFFILRCKIQYTSEKGLIWYIRIFGHLVASNEKNFVEKKKKKKEKKDLSGGQKMEELAKVEEDREEPTTFAEQPVETIKKPIVENKKNIEQEAKKVSFVQKSKKVIERIKGVLIRWKKKITSIPEKLVSMKDKIIKNKDRLTGIKEYFLGEENKEVMKEILSRLKKMFGHIWPNKLRGRVEFGLEDPYTMGQILAVLGILMPIYQDKLTVIPDFEEEKLKGDFSLAGRIIPGYLVLQLFILIMNKEVRRVIKEGKEQLLGGTK